LSADADHARRVSVEPPGWWEAFLNPLSWRPDAILICVLALIVGYLVVPPLAVLILGSLTDTPPAVPPHYTWETLEAAYGEPRGYRALLMSIVYSAIVATLVLIIGSFLAWVVERTNSRVRVIADLFALAPILMPAVVMVSGWILLLGPRAGLINLIAVEYLGFKTAPFDVYTFQGMIWVGMLQELPLAFLWMWPAFRSMNPELEEAALTSGAGMFTVLRRITIPMLKPTLLAAWIIFFIYALGALSVPILLGLPGRVFLYATEIYLAAARVPSNLNLASAYSLIFLFVSVFGVFAYQRATSDSSRYATIKGKAFRPRLISVGPWQWLITACAVILLLLVAILPMLVLVWNAFMPYPQAPSWKSLELFTTRNFARAFSYEPAKRALVNSLLLGIGAGVIATVIGALIAWCVLRGRRLRFAIAILDQLATAPIAIPAVIFGVGLLWLYLVLPLPIYGTLWILLIAYVTLHLPYATRICISGLSQLDRELEEAGQVAGAGWWVVFRRIVLVLIGPSILTSVVYVALRSFREYAASIFLVSPGTEVFSVLVLALWEGGDSNVLSAYVTCVMFLLIALVWLGNFIARRTAIRL
jgi:iron(III) transport system permease protein